ncbi:MAG: hypothetical protein EOO71_34320 [Myxococcaceae bacterium]|nr:MAG: hypothetical protein EOO71_34320 [Myxococcaceae bacterium]
MAPTAKAETVALSCVGAEAAKFTPGLLFTEQQVAFDSLGVSGCAGVPLNILSAISVTQGQGPQSCLVASATSAITIQWSDGTSSVAQGNTVANLKPAGEIVIVLTGTVVSGRFVGAGVVRTLTLLNTNLLGCFFPPGVTDAAGPTTLVVTGI